MATLLLQLSLYTLVVSSANQAHSSKAIGCLHKGCTYAEIYDEMTPLNSACSYSASIHLHYR